MPLARALAAGTDGPISLRHRGHRTAGQVPLAMETRRPIMDPFWIRLVVMPNLSIKNVPEQVVEKLRARAAANHRSLQGELMALVCRATGDRESGWESRSQEETRTGWKSVEQVLSEHTAARPEAVTKGPRAVDVIRKDRDGR